MMSRTAGTPHCTAPAEISLNRIGQRGRAELLAVGAPELWREFMAELRTIHLGEPWRRNGTGRDGPSVSERLAEAYAAACVAPLGPPQRMKPLS